MQTSMINLGLPFLAGLPKQSLAAVFIMRYSSRLRFSSSLLVQMVFSVARATVVWFCRMVDCWWLKQNGKPTRAGNDKQRHWERPWSRQKKNNCCRNSYQKKRTWYFVCSNYFLLYLRKVGIT